MTAAKLIPPRPETTPRILSGRLKAAASLFIPLGLGLAIPFLGLGVSFISLFLAGTYGPRVWPGVSRRRARLAGVAAFVALWVPMFFGAFGPIGLPGGWDVYANHLIPLCEPAGFVGMWVPTIVGLVAYGLGCVASAGWRRPMLWPVGSLAGVLAMGATWSVIAGMGGSWVC